MFGGVGRRIASLAVTMMAAVALAACSQTTRVGEETSGATLAKSSKAVAVMRLGGSSPNCDNVGVWLGVREGPGFRLHTPVAVINVRSLAESPVAEVELPPGEYHVVSFACGTAKGPKQVTSFDRTTGLVRTSYASFTLTAGEIVNVGMFNFHAARSGLNAFGRPFRITITVTDWPVADLDFYKQKRPAIYAQMRTRLMTVTPREPQEPDEDDCSELLALKAEGKVQNLPAQCAAVAAGPVAKAGKR